jgi:hypothetical protein
MFALLNLIKNSIQSPILRMIMRNLHMLSHFKDITQLGTNAGVLNNPKIGFL